MRIVELHANLDPIQRSNGHSSVAAAAYRAGIELTDNRTGIVHDYTRKQGVEYTKIYAPDNAPEWVYDRGELWNAAEKKENRKNSCTAHEWDVGFLAEFNEEQRRETGDKIAREIMSRYNCAVDIAYHKPGKDGDQRNYHAHIMFTSRGFDPETKDGWSRTKIKELRHSPIEVDGEKTTVGKEEVKDFREFIATRMNEIAERDGLDVRVEHLSFEERGIDREPEIKMGAHATQMEREGKESERGNELRDIWKRNMERENLQDQADRIELEIVQERARALEQAQEERRRFQELYDLQRATLEQERAQYQQQVDDLSARLEERSRLAVLWDKMRGRLGWRAEEELNTARMSLEENQERARALELSEQMQQQREREERERQAEIYEPVPPQPELSEYESIEPLHLQQEIEPPRFVPDEITPDDIQITHTAPPEPSLDDYAEMFRQSREENTPADIEIQTDMDRE